MKAEAKIIIVRAAGLKAADLNGKSDPYVKVIAQGGAEIDRTPDIQKTLDPEWNHEVKRLVAFNPSEEDGSSKNTVTLEFWDKDRFTKDDALGSAKLDLGKELRDNHGEHEVVLDLNTKGTVTLLVSWPGAPAPGRQPDTFLAVADGNEVGMKSSWDEMCAALAVDASGKYAAQGHNNGAVALFDLSGSGAVKVGEVAGDEESEPAMDIKFSPGGEKVAAVWLSGRIRVYTVPDMGVTLLGEDARVPSPFCRLEWTDDGKLVHLAAARTSLISLDGEGKIEWQKLNTMGTVELGVVVGSDALHGLLTGDDDERVSTLALADGSTRTEWKITFPKKDNLRMPTKGCSGAAAGLKDTVFTTSKTVGTNRGPRSDLISFDTAAGSIRWQKEEVACMNDFLVCTKNGFLVIAAKKTEFGKIGGHTIIHLYSAASGEKVGKYVLGSGEDAIEDSAGARCSRAAAGPGDNDVSLRCEDGQIRVFTVAEKDGKAEMTFKALLTGVDGSTITSEERASLKMGGSVIVANSTDEKKGVQVWKLGDDAA